MLAVWEAESFSADWPIFLLFFLLRGGRYKTRGITVRSQDTENFAWQRSSSPFSPFEPKSRQQPANSPPTLIFFSKKISPLLSHAVQNQIPLFISSAAASSTERLEDDSSRSLFGNHEWVPKWNFKKSSSLLLLQKCSKWSHYYHFPPDIFFSFQFSAHFPQPAFSHSCYVEVLSRHHRKRERRVKSTRMEWSPYLPCSSADPSFPPLFH